MTTLPFQVVSPFTPAGDQPQAIASLVKGIQEKRHNQVLLGVTGSGKTFTMAHVMAQLQRPALILAQNKTLAAQLYEEMKAFFPHNAVEYFVSYYDYYQPEAYIAHKDLYIEKEATINETIDRMRHAATQALLERRDVVVVASVSCIYGIGSPETYSAMTLTLENQQTITSKELVKQLVSLQYRRNDISWERGCFRVRGDRIDIFPAHYEDRSWRIDFFDDTVEAIYELDALTGERLQQLERVKLYANSHYVTPGPTLQQAVQHIRKELKSRLEELRALEKHVEAQRLEQRVMFDIETMTATGTCQGIENYSRYLTGRGAGEPPPTLFEYLPEDALLFVDESHVSVPQLGGMSRGDAARKQSLSEHGFRLPSCRDNRPLTFEEWDRMRPQTIFVSATPQVWEMKQSQDAVVEQLIRPTGLLDPLCDVRPTENQIDDLIHECRQRIQKGHRVLITTLTKKMAEALAEYLEEAGIKGRYLHSDIKTLERIDHIQDLRKGVFDVLVGINLLREGLDIPECSLVAILDADKEGFLRSRTSLIQTMGRAARHEEGHVILYADRITDSMRAALDETARRRKVQEEYNKAHGITPASVKKSDVEVREKTWAHVAEQAASYRAAPQPTDESLSDAELEAAMHRHAENLEFEKAAAIRDQLKKRRS